MTVSGTTAKGLPDADNTRRIAVKGASPQFVAVLGADTEMHFAVIPVMCLSSLNFAATKVLIIFHPTNIFLKFFLEKNKTFN